MVSIISIVAFLRGINSGLNPIIKMLALKKTFEELGFENLKTVIASGDVIFESKVVAESDLEKAIEKSLPKALGFESATIVYKLADLRRLSMLDAFKAIKVTPSTRLFVTFIKSHKKVARNSAAMVLR